MLGRRPALQGVTRQPRKVLLVGREIQFSQRAGRVPSHGVRVTFTGCEVARHGAGGEFSASFIRFHGAREWRTGLPTGRRDHRDESIRGALVDR